MTIEQVLQEKKTFDVTLAFEKTGIDDVKKGWKEPGMSKDEFGVKQLLRRVAPSKPQVVESLESNSNVLHASIEAIEDHEEAGRSRLAVVASGADKKVHCIDTVPPFSSLPSSIYGQTPSDSPVLSCTTLFKKYMLTSSMSGKLTLHNLSNGLVINERKDHQKYVVKVIAKEDGDVAWIATAAWDSKIYVYRVQVSDGHIQEMGEPRAELKLPTNPESIIFIDHPEIAMPVLLVSRRDSTFLYYYALPEHITAAAASSPLSLVYLGRQNLAPHSNAWIAFTPSALALSPTDPGLLAVATSAVPHMKLIIVRLMVPPPPSADGTIPSAPAPLTQASQAQSELAQQDREAAAILIHCTTLAPQTPYSTPALAWRPDGSGVFVNGDDGVVRGLEANTGKIITTLKGGHEVGSKIRCICAGYDSLVGGQEIVVSGGFDRKLVVWSIE